jgi:hypothetical protein
VLKPTEWLVAKVDLGTDRTLRKEWGNLSEHQLGDPASKKLREELESDPNKFEDRYMVRDKILYCKDGRTHPYWRIVLPRQLETRVIRYVPSLLGHQGTDNCMIHIAHFSSKVVRKKGAKLVAQLRHLSTCEASQ